MGARCERFRTASLSEATLCSIVSSRRSRYYRWYDLRIGRRGVSVRAAYRCQTVLPSRLLGRRLRTVVAEFRAAEKELLGLEGEV